jgi:Asp-tRNA(Asn)/Glu-tRNA(Gln) amidotransferase A subunit family amidase
MDRRTFLVTSLAAARASAADEPARLETFRQWSDASPGDREVSLQRLVDRIRDADQTIQAWVQVAPQPSTGRGRLSRIPFGVKDIIETKGLATEYGSPVYKGRIGTSDAWIVRDLRARGAVLLGKTRTTQFAYRTPGPTRNPRNLAHTPGGSSSGSAAAVAAGMAPFAIGTQTGGSVIRPASYCGICGFKPTYGLLPTEGVLPLAKSLDTLGFFTHTAADMRALWESMGHAAGSTENFALAAPDPLPDVEAPMAMAFQNAVGALRRAGLTIQPIDISEMLAKLHTANRLVMFYEGARFHQQRFQEHGDRLADIAALVRDGLKLTATQYDEARRYFADCRAKVAKLFQTTPVILTPAAPGPAPSGLSTTGDPRMNSPWTSLGTPAITVPMPSGKGLPLGIQLSAGHNQESRLIGTAIRIENVLRFETP